MEDTATKKPQQPPKKITDFQDEIIAMLHYAMQSQQKTISVLEDNIELLRETIDLKEKLSKSTEASQKYGEC